ncbi:AI-2E family transporter [Nitrosococcus wardiae]|uniref:AI-2E family transporter n=1 Tax=Nitrosococcus wardiae TaxID=1814290 RepID=A0A4P7C2H2_9GAMM|nr:AI-2E family transporter [Nitrosococcus wardiae]QBQ55714.1 AI-2E family transporter [Nitrosococcus wardiae]
MTVLFSSRALTGIFILALFFSLYVARSFLLPIIIAFLLNLILAPLVRSLKQLGVNDGLAAALIVIALLEGAAFAVLALAEPASQWMQRSPVLLQQAERKLFPLKEAVKEVEKTAEEVEDLTKAKPEGYSIEIEQGSQLKDILFTSTWGTVTNLIFIFFLLYFFLAFGDLFLHKLVKVMPTWTQKRQALEMVYEVQAKVSRYLLTITLINLGLGLVVGTTLYFIDLPNALLWGALAGLFNFIPYLGPLGIFIILTGAAILSFEELSQVLLVPGVFLFITTLEGQLITPLILGRSLSLNPLVIFLGITFGVWFWGIPGAFTAVPLLVIAKTICDHSSSLTPISEFLAR